MAPLENLIKSRIMKQLKIFVLLVFVVLKGFSQSKPITNWKVPYDRNTLYITMDSSKQITEDSMRRVTRDGVKLDRIGRSWSHSEMSVYPGADASTAFQKGVNRSYVIDVNMDADSAQRIIINGTVTFPKNKRLVFKNGLTFTGTGTINLNGCIIDAPDDRQIFDTTLTITNARGRGNQVYAVWFGVDPSSTWVDKAWQKVNSAVLPNQTIILPSYTVLFQKPFNFDNSVKGDSGSVLKFNTTSTDTAVIFANVNKSKIALSGFGIDGSNRADWGLRLRDSMTDVTLSNLEVYNCYQYGSTYMQAVGVRVEGNCDRFYFYKLNIHDVNAPNNGVSRGLLGSYGGGNRAPKGGVIDGCTFSNIFPATDGDHLVWQDFKDTSDLTIMNCKHYGITKRGQKLQAPGIFSHHNEFWSDYWKTNGARAINAIALYSSQLKVENNFVHSGIYQATFEIGSGLYDVYDVDLNHNWATTDSGALITGSDGIRGFGKKNRNIKIEDNYTRYNRFNIFLDWGGSNFFVRRNQLYYSVQNAFTNIGGSNAFPDNWVDNFVVEGNFVMKSGNANAFDIWRIRNFTFRGNSSDSSTNLLNYIALRVDSLLGQTVVTDNQSIHHTRNPNWGTWANRPALSSSTAGIGWKYSPTDRGDTTFKYTQNGWIAEAGGGSGGGLSQSQVAQQIADSLRKNFYYINLGKSVGGTWFRTPNDSTLAARSFVLGSGFDSTGSTDSTFKINLSGYTGTSTYVNFTKWVGINKPNPVRALHVGGQVRIDTINIVANPTYLLAEGTSGDVNKIAVSSLVTVAKNATRDSIIITFGNNRYAVKDSVGGGGGGGITLGYGLSGTTTVLVDTSKVSTKANVNHVVDSLKIELGIAEGSYIPTFSNLTNVTGGNVAGNGVKFVKWLDNVTVYGGINVTSNAGSTLSIFDMTIPPAYTSAFTTVSDIGGSGSMPLQNVSAAITWQGTTNAARFTFMAPNTSAQYISFSFTYKIK
jgi:hypothetical protein